MESLLDPNKATTAQTEGHEPLDQSFFPTETERFCVEDILYARADTAGVVRAGNAPFLSAAGYIACDLNGAPQELICRSAMPRAVIGLICEELRKNQTVGAYTLNNTKDGHCYWVFAILVPIRTGFISIQVKPLSPMLDRIRRIYAETLAAEHEESDQEDGRNIFFSALMDLGFPTYQDCMSYAISEEIRARDKALGRRGPRDIDTLENIAKTTRKVESEAGTISNLYDKTVLIPYNMRLAACRLEGADGPIGVISSNHQKMSEELADVVQEFLKTSALGNHSIGQAVFLKAVSDLTGEMRARLKSEIAGSGKLTDTELPDILMLETSFQVQTRQAILEVSKRAHLFANHCKTMRRILSGLELTRIMCKIERSRWSGSSGGLDEIVNRLKASGQEWMQAIKAIEGVIDDIQISCHMVLREKAVLRFRRAGRRK